MSVPSPPSPVRNTKPPRRKRAGRPARRRAPLTPLQGRLLLVGGALFVTLLYLVLLRGGQDGIARIEPSADGTTTVHVTLSEFKIEPQSISVKRGAITFVVTNKGTQAHNLAVETIIPRSGDEQTQLLVGVKAMQPGQTNSNSYTLPPGKYRWRSSLANDDDLGMYGVIEVRQ